MAAFKVRDVFGYKVWKQLNEAWDIDYDERFIDAKSMWLDNMHDIEIVHDGKYVRVPVQRFGLAKDYIGWMDCSDYYFAYHEPSNQLFHLHTEHYTIRD